jgi:hypothetical protein
MAKGSSRHNQPWTSEDIKQLRHLVNRNMPARAIGLRLGRTEIAVQSKASELAISLSPANQFQNSKGS